MLGMAKSGVNGFVVHKGAKSDVLKFKFQR